MMGSTKLLSVLIVVGLLSVFVEAAKGGSQETSKEIGNKGNSKEKGNKGNKEIGNKGNSKEIGNKGNKELSIIPGQQCSPQDPTPCVPNAECRMHASSDCDREHGYCYCLPGFYSTGRACLPRVRLTKLCTDYGYSDDKCDTIAADQCEDQHAVCKRATRYVRRCLCDGPHYEDVNRICVYRAPLGGQCTQNSECSTMFAECTFKNGKSTCECNANYNRNGNTCTIISAKKPHPDSKDKKPHPESDDKKH